MDTDLWRRRPGPVVTALAAILLAGVALRAVPLVAAAAGPTVWDDRDGYTHSGAYVADHPLSWTWLGNVVQFHTYLKAPLYPAMMIVFAKVWRSAFPLNAAIFQVIVGFLAAGLAIFKIGQSLHSDRAGLIAAGMYTFYPPNFAQVIFLQETIFIPLSLVAFAIFLQGVVKGGGNKTFALAGFLFGLTALTRSLPLYYLPVASVVYLLSASDRRSAGRQIGVLLLVFFATLLPYSIFISYLWGQWVIVDTQGLRAIVERYSDHPASRRPGMVEGARMVAGAIATSPGPEILDRLEKARAFFYLKGGQWMQVYALKVPTATASWALKVFVHLTHDLPTAAALLLGPLGLAMARRRQVAGLLVLWPAIGLALMTAFLWASARYTSSFLWELMVGAAVVFAGDWRKPRVAALVAAAAWFTVVAVPLVASIPLTMRGRADYGLRSPSSFAECSPSERMTYGDAGFNVLPAQGVVEFGFRLMDPAVALKRNVSFEIKMDGERVSFDRFGSDGRAHVRLAAPSPLVFIEIRVLQDGDSSPHPVGIRMETGQLHRYLLYNCS